MKLQKIEYFSDDCIFEDPLYISARDLIICPLCNEILKQPYMCNECQNVYCKKCLENHSNLKKCPNDNKKTKFKFSKDRNEILSRLKYKCKNCSEIVAQSDIDKHLKENCNHKEIRREKTLAEIIKSRKELIKIPREDIPTKEVSYSLTSKNKFYNNNFFKKCSHNIRRYKCRENLSYRKVREINYKITFDKI